MTTETPNTPNVPPQVPPQPLRPEDERTWAALAHASVLLDLVTGFGGLIGALVIWLMYKERSAAVAFHALQSLVFQGILSVILIIFVGGTWIVGFIFSFVTLGFGALVAVPLMFITFGIGVILGLGGLIYGLYGAYQVYEGRSFRYLWVGDWLAGQMAARNS